ncbi:TPA: cytochrome P450 [Burkholderia multivorans]|uniref:cytochrome P450 n=2 Tax=Burkholderia multivorans TaxID=87883 RepID=UPI000CFED477|nr:cytochrome P450 [Burkholderia multivorans]PRH26409.1 cytochrome P450 [Burkholderia multivorans]HEM7839470.1 cytochrome P450 [Burkholderia multivorans]HEM7869561.1 cytochrome P450 [Burkholderia multivorans]HEM7904875.1 cytochrome P450 [Burkholderia multivorans]
MSGCPFSQPTFPIARQCPFLPPDEYRAFRQASGPVKVRMWDGHDAWLLTRYDDVRAVLGDNRFSGDPQKPGYPSLSAARDAVLDLEPAFIRMDPPQHGHYRRMLTKEFMIKRVSDMRPRIESIFNRLVDELIAKGPPANLVEDLFLPLTSEVIAWLLDVPHEDHGFFQEQSRLKVLLDVDPSIPKAASDRILSYLDRLIAEREKDAEQRTDLLSRLIVEQVRPGHLTHRELVVMADLLLMAGHETTANQMALGVYSFLTNPDQMQLLRDDPSLLRNAVEEMLRFHTIVHYNAFRVAVEDVEVAGQLIRKGEGVIALISGANHDPAAFPQPEKFDITRKADHHVAFSYGIHQCLGQPLARVELQVVFGALFQRMPTLRFAVPVEEIKGKGDHFVQGLETLPVTW